jgi:hypothetical protein
VPCATDIACPPTIAQNTEDTLQEHHIHSDAGYEHEHDPVFPDHGLNDQGNLTLSAAIDPHPDDSITRSTDDTKISEIYAGCDAIPDDSPGHFDDLCPDPAGHIVPNVAALQTAVSFIDRLHAATLDQDSLSDNVCQQLHTPVTSQMDLLDKDLRLCLEIFLATTSGSEEAYTNTLATFKCHSPKVVILSHAQIKLRIQELIGILPVMTDMCVSLCIAFTGPFGNHTICPVCQEACYKEVIQRHKLSLWLQKQFLTIPVSPQIQVQWHSEKSAYDMGHHQRAMEIIVPTVLQHLPINEYNDVYCLQEFIQAVLKDDIKHDDMVLMLSIDGAQLYQHKQSDCWIYIWVLLNLPPDIRYKKKYVLPGGFMLGPHKPKNLDSFLFPGLHHLATLQCNGLLLYKDL